MRGADYPAYVVCNPTAFYYGGGFIKEQLLEKSDSQIGYRDQQNKQYEEKDCFAFGIYNDAFAFANERVC